MATVVPPPPAVAASAADQAATATAADLLKNLSLDTHHNNHHLDVPLPTTNTNNNIKTSSVNQQPVSLDSVTAPNGQIHPPSDRSLSPLLPEYLDPTLCFLPNSYPAAYYYGGYDGTGNEWEEYSRGVDMTSGVYGDNGSLMYHGYGYAPYPPYSPAHSPVPTLGNDGQLYGPQHYQYPPYFQHLTPTSSPYTPSPAAAPQGDISTSVAADQKPLSVDIANPNSNGLPNAASVKGSNASDPLKPNNQKTSFGSNSSYLKGATAAGLPASGFLDPRYAFDGVQSPTPWLDGSLYSDRQQRPNGTTASNGTHAPASKIQSNRPNSHYMGLQHPRPFPAYVNGMFPNKLYGQQYGSTYGSGMVYGSNGFGMRANGRGWMALDGKNKPRGRGYYGYNNEHIDGLNELTKGPRAKSNKNQKGFTPVVLAVKGQTLPLNGNADEEKKEKENDGISEREQYNCPEFPEEYADAKFFVIKSYSEDDVHKSIKYNVWASTPNGNKKLDAAYKEALAKDGGCPVFLFFSVNASGQFVGLAEMVGSVDFDKSCEYWQQDKWNGSFPVKWHIVKDVPNSLLKHITLDNNENKSVTNSRDTQEVKLEPGLKMIKLFKEHISKTCLLDDFGFYENRQKTIQEKKAKQKQFQKQVWEGKAASEKKDSVNELKLQKPSVVSDLSKETLPNGKSNGDLENGSVVNMGDGL